MPQFSVIDPRQFNLLVHSSPEPFLLDVRTPHEFEGVHAAGARNMPLEMINSATLLNDHNLQKDSQIYLICEKGTRAQIAAGIFVKNGFMNIRVIDGGTSSWIAKGYPVISSGKKVMSIERQVRIGAGSLVLLGIILGFLVHPALFGLSAFIGAGLVFAGITDWCGMGLLLARAPWNR